MSQEAVNVSSSETNYVTQKHQFAADKKSFGYEKPFAFKMHSKWKLLPLSHTMHFEFEQFFKAKFFSTNLEKDFKKRI